MKPETIISIILGLITTIAISLASFSLKWTFDANADLQIVKMKLAQADTKRDDAQDRQLKMFWKYNAWLHGQVNQLRYKAGMEPVDNPNLD